MMSLQCVLAVALCAALLLGGNNRSNQSFNEPSYENCPACSSLLPTATIICCERTSKPHFLYLLNKCWHPARGKRQENSRAPLICMRRMLEHMSERDILLRERSDAKKIIFFHLAKTRSEYKVCIM